MSSTYADAMLAAAHAEGFTVASIKELPPEVYQRLAVQVRPARAKIRDGWAAGTALTARNLSLRQVPPEVAQANQTVCERNTCGNYVVLQGVYAACNHCQCGGKLLQSKWSYRGGFCPLETPLWDNRKWSSEGAQGAQS